MFALVFTRIVNLLFWPILFPFAFAFWLYTRRNVRILLRHCDDPKTVQLALRYERHLRDYVTFRRFFQWSRADTEESRNLVGEMQAGGFGRRRKP